MRAAHVRRAVAGRANHPYDVFTGGSEKVDHVVGGVASAIDKDLVDGGASVEGRSMVRISVECKDGDVWGVGRGEDARQRKWLGGKACCEDKFRAGHRVGVVVGAGDEAPARWLQARCGEDFGLELDDGCEFESCGVLGEVLVDRFAGHVFARFHAKGGVHWEVDEFIRAQEVVGV